MTPSLQIISQTFGEIPQDKLTDELKQILKVIKRSSVPEVPGGSVSDVD